MLATIATRLTDQLYFRCPLDPSRKAIYEYGIQLSLSTLASMCSIVMLGLLLKNPASAFIFLGVFFFLRLFSGGYHAPTYARCFLLTNSVYLAVVGTSYWIVHFQLYHLLPVVVVASCVVVIALSPVRNKHHPLSEKTYRKNRKIAIVSGLHREFVFSDSFLLADLSALCGRLLHVANSGCCYDAIYFKKKGGLRKMTTILSALASLIEIFANLGAGMASHGCGYEPELPEELRK